MPDKSERLHALGKAIGLTAAALIYGCVLVAVLWGSLWLGREFLRWVSTCGG